MSQFKYKVQAYNATPVGVTAQIVIVVRANSESEAIAKARKVAERSDYAVVAIEVIDDFEMDIQAVQQPADVKKAASKPKRK